MNRLFIMQIEGINGLGGVNPSDGPKQPVRNQGVRSDEAEFQKTDSIKRALLDEPDIRPEVVAAGLKKFNDAQYPSGPTTEGIARLLADKLK